MQHIDFPVLLISASDSSAAAGMQVDLRVVNDLGHPARCAVTALTIQGEKGLLGIDPASPENLVRAIDTAVSEPPGVRAVKIGLITGENAVRAVSEGLSGPACQGIPIVLDPVMKSTPGSKLSSEEARSILLERLIPLATLVTPNREELAELAALSGEGQGSEEEMAQRLTRKGADAVLVTGGDDGSSICMDILYQGGKLPVHFRHPRIGDGPTRGTGCALSSALAVFLARGLPVDEAVRLAIGYIAERIAGAAQVGSFRLLFPGKDARSSGKV
ncbi:MAG: hydroxymethylpyrimidine/phosphomethylpyrimidine kinase [Proteobacteria bacterium]|nr:hydroxymethylpyrimidine/phosphomethylpyrimidine kinase [Pseudomonadota bacterium]